MRHTAPGPDSLTAESKPRAALSRAWLTTGSHSLSSSSGDILLQQVERHRQQNHILHQEGDVPPHRRKPAHRRSPAIRHKRDDRDRRDKRRHRPQGFWVLGGLRATRTLPVVGRSGVPEGLPKNHSDRSKGFILRLDEPYERGCQGKILPLSLRAEWML
jgi:hypothetical protein